MYWIERGMCEKDIRNTVVFSIFSFTFLVCVWIHFHGCVSFFRLVCNSVCVCAHMQMCVWLAWRGHIIKTSHFRGIPFTPYCLPHCWKIQVIYQSIQATCVLFPMCFVFSRLSVFLLQYALCSLLCFTASFVLFISYCTLFWSNSTQIQYINVLTCCLQTCYV